MARVICEDTKMSRSGVLDCVLCLGLNVCLIRKLSDAFLLTNAEFPRSSMTTFGYRRSGTLQHSKGPLPR